LARSDCGTKVRILWMSSDGSFRRRESVSILTILEDSVLRVEAGSDVLA
jgi:hypothetical protein